jgi:integrase
MAGQIEPIGFGDDGLYRVRIRIQSRKTGKRGTLSETIKAKNKQTAMRQANARLKALAQAKNVTTPTTKESLNSAFDRYLENVKKPVVKRQTYDDYKKVYDRYVRKSIGALSLGKITRDEVSGLYASLTVSPRTIRYLNMILKAAFREFIHQDLVIKNPCEVVLPKQRRREYRVFTADEYQRVVNTASLFWKTLVMLDVETGLRPEEFLALTWANITDTHIKVRKALVWFPKGEYEFTDPKNDASRRTIPLSPALSTQLKLHRKALLELRLKQGPYWADLDLVFPTSIGTPFTLSNLARKFKSLMLVAKVDETPMPMRPYDMRHTMATWLLEAGENIKVVSERLGHSSIRVTADTYLHVSEGMQESATRRLEALVEVKPLSKENVSKLCPEHDGSQTETALNNGCDAVKPGVTRLRKSA